MANGKDWLKQERWSDRFPANYVVHDRITTTFSSDYELSKIILNKLTGSQINSEQNHKFERAWKTASLINNFGKKATSRYLYWVWNRS